MTSKMTSKLYTDRELDFERVFEIRILDLKKRDAKQKSFSLFVSKGTKCDEYITMDELKSFLQEAIEKKYKTVDG